jgi:thioredoxin reductase (NADPH)
VINEDIYDVIIVGGGPAGMAAGIYAKRAAVKTLLIESDNIGGQINTSDVIENYIGFDIISGGDLSSKISAHASRYGLEIIKKKVNNIDPGVDFHEIKLDDDLNLKTHSVIVATGGNPRRLNIPGESENFGKGVSYCAVCDGFFFQDRTVTVIGGGDSAVEESLYLSKIAKKVYLVHRRNELRAGRLLQKRAFAENNIEIMWNTVPKKINSDKTGVVSVQLEDTVTSERHDLATDGVFIFIGFKPNNRLLPVDVKMNPDGYVITNEKCETSVPGIYVVGDLREKYAKQIITAASDGCIAALAAAHYTEEKKAEVLAVEEKNF